ncbi:hypothetical protein [Brevibacterium luteolum]|uniref:Uncharacterized protein n=1 Tax=Brevibacterium luteolum TaxID=199591 RepID=A0A6G8KT23_9MICO|nr:hypothetical protein [Brevibacterium luteolum]MBU8579353.1 hypothetical protein [Brevibacterium luteolum]QIN27967.1 hypothetical protein EW640_00715 [Brevibacterium luteolum]
MNSLLLAVDNPLMPSAYDAAWSAMIFIPMILGLIMVIIGLVYLFKLDQPKPLRLALGILLLFLPPLGLFVVMYMYYTGRKSSTA